MSHFVKTLSASLLSTVLIGSVNAQATPTNPPPPVQPARPGIQIQAPGVNIQTPGAGVQTPGVQVQAPGVNVQIPIAVAQIGVPGSVNDDNVANNPYYPRTPWFTNPSVREELRLNDQQHADLNRHYERAWVQYNKNRNVVDSSLSTQKQAVRENELRADFQKQFDPAVNSAFTDPAVRARYNQLNYQYQGYNAFQDPAVQEQLNLTADQQQQFTRYGTAWDRQMANWRTDYPADRERVAQELRQSRREALRRIDNTLTPAQRAKWTSLTGKPYEFSSDVYFPAQPTTTLKPVVPATTP